MTQEFNADEYLAATQKAAIATKFTPVDEGEYPAFIQPGSIKIEEVPFRDGRTGKRFNATWEINDPAVAEKLGMEKPTVRQQFLLDLTPEGELAGGVNKNIRLGKLLLLAGIDPNRPEGWSYQNLEGVSGKIRVKHRPDKDDAEIVYADVVAVARL